MAWPCASEFLVCWPLTSLIVISFAVTPDCFLWCSTLSLIGHALAEAVTVTSYFYTENQINQCEGESTLEYVRDVAQEAAEYLTVNKEQLGPQSCLEILKRFSSLTQAADMELPANGSDCSEADVQLRKSSAAEAGLKQLDEEITHAMANMEYPQQWKNIDSHPGEGGNETGSESVSHEMLSSGFLFPRGNFLTFFNHVYIYIYISKCTVLNRSIKRLKFFFFLLLLLYIWHLAASTKFT